MAERPGLRVAAEYKCYPVWVVLPDGGLQNPSPEELGLPADLSEALMAWADALDAIYPPDDPASAAFPSLEAEVSFAVVGREIAERVAVAVGDRFHVIYRDRTERAEITLS